MRHRRQAPTGEIEKLVLAHNMEYSLVEYTHLIMYVWLREDSVTRSTPSGSDPIQGARQTVSLRGGKPSSVESRQRADHEPS